MCFINIKSEEKGIELFILISTMESLRRALRSLKSITLSWSVHASLFSDITLIHIDPIARLIERGAHKKCAG